MSVTIVVTGHRPPRLAAALEIPEDETYGDELRGRLEDVAEHYLMELSPDEVILGMSLGWDQAVATACVALGIPFVAALPTRGMGGGWPRASRQRRDFLLAAGSISIMGGLGPPSQRFAVRDLGMVHYVVARGGLCLALWDGNGEGGTARTVGHAKDAKLKVVNAWGRLIG